MWHDEKPSDETVSYFWVSYETCHKKKGFLELEFRNDDYRTVVKLRLSLTFPDRVAAISAVLNIGTREEFEQTPYFQALVKRQLARTFIGELAKIPTDLQRQLLKLSDYQSENFIPSMLKGKLYLEMNVPESGTVYNTLQVNLAARTASTVKTQVLPRLRVMAGSIQDAPTFYGVKLRVRMQHRNFVRESLSKFESLEIYLPYDAIQQFANHDITEQKLMDQCVVLVDGDRVDVTMALAVTP